MTRRVTEGERVYTSTYNLTHYDTVVADLRRMESMGIDMAVFWLPSYGYRNMSSQELQFQQMEILGEHVLPKIGKDTKPIEMDFEGKTVRPFAVA